MPLCEVVSVSSAYLSFSQHIAVLDGKRVLRDRKSVDWILGESRGDLEIQERPIRAPRAGEAKGTREERLLRAESRQGSGGNANPAWIFCWLLTFQGLFQPAQPQLLAATLNGAAGNALSSKHHEMVLQRASALQSSPGRSSSHHSSAPRWEPLLGVTPGVSLAPGGGTAQPLTRMGTQELCSGLGAQRTALPLI